MPRAIDPGVGDAIGLDDLVEALDAAKVDPRDEDGFAALGPWLARLGRNRTFLADLAIAELEQRFTGQDASSYGAQVFLLRPPNGRYMIRANFWPAREDAVVRASGTAPFFYDHAHDHNFSFLTIGYLGPGYWSDYYLFDGREGAQPGDPAGLTFVERSRLDPGTVLLYRAHRDVHVQLPPDAFSISLNVLGYDPAQPWRAQYRFDVAADTIAEVLTATPAEALVSIAAHLGGGTGLALAAEFARRHPAPRMRTTALAALASAAGDRASRAAVYALAADDADPQIRGHARHRLSLLERPAP